MALWQWRNEKPIEVIEGSLEVKFPTDNMDR